MPVLHGQFPSGFPPALPISNKVSSDGRNSTALDDPMRRQFASQPASTAECDVYRPGVFNIYEADPEFQLFLPLFMDRYLENDSGHQDSYDLPEVDFSSSNSPSDVGAPPGKRPCPFAGDMLRDGLANLHGATLPTLQSPQVPYGTFNLDEAQAGLMTSPNPEDVTPKTPELPESRRLVDELAMTPTLSSGETDPDLISFVVAVKDLKLGPQWHTLRALQKKSSFGKMVEFAKTLGGQQGESLLTQARKWKAKGKVKASQRMALLYLFTSCTTSLSGLDEFMSLLPLTWPSALEHLRKECLSRRADLTKQKTSEQRSELVVRLYERYGG
jgi:hypothetical protein